MKVTQEEAAAKQQECEREITAILTKFEAETGAHVDRVCIPNIERTECRDQTTIAWNPGQPRTEEPKVKLCVTF